MGLSGEKRFEALSKNNESERDGGDDYDDDEFAWSECQQERIEKKLDEKSDSLNSDWKAVELAFCKKIKDVVCFV